MNPCLPIHHTAATLRAWSVWRAAHPHWVAKVVVPVCVRAGVLGLPLALPGAAFLPPVPYGGVAFGGPVLSGPAYEIGAVFAPGFYEIPELGLPAPAILGGRAPRAGADFGGNAASPTRTVGNTSTAVGPETVGGSPTLTPMISGDVPHWLPDREVPPTDVPEPSTWLVMVGALYFAIRQRVWK